MEKFAVDLEKVLDEFEFNEEHEENISVPPIKISSLPSMGFGSLRQVTHVRPPAASYRRPSFEPINLADADFAASPPKPSEIVSFSQPLSGVGLYNENQESISVSGNDSFRNNINSDGIVVASINNDVNTNKDVILESSGASIVRRKSSNPKSSDEKPDLLEYNTDLDSSSMEIYNQLPDLTSVRLSSTINNNDISKASNSLDLISTASRNFVMEDREVVDPENTPKPLEHTDIKIDNEIVTLDSPQCANTASSEVISNMEHIKREATGVSNLEDTIAHESSFLQTGIRENNAETQNELNNLYESELVKPSIISEVKQIESKQLSNLEDSDLRSVVVENSVETQNELNNFYESELAKHHTISEVRQGLEETISRLDDPKDQDKNCIVHDGVEKLKPVGFSSDLNISEGDLEEYLNELVEESILSTEEFETNQISGSLGNKPYQEKEQAIMESEITTQIIESSSESCSVDNSNCGIQELDINDCCMNSSPNLGKLRDSLEGSLRESVSDDDKNHCKKCSLPQHEVTMSSVTINKREIKEIKSNNFSTKNKNHSLNTNPFESDGSSEETNHTNKVNPETGLGLNTTKTLEEQTKSLISVSKSTNPFDDCYEESPKEIDSVETNSITLAEEYSKETALGDSEENNTKETRNKENCLENVENISNSAISNTLSCASEEGQIPRENQEVLCVTESKNTMPKHSINNTSDVKNVLGKNSNLTEALASCSNRSQSPSSSVDNSVDYSTSQLASETSSIEEAAEPTEDRPTRPSSLELPKKITVDQKTVHSPTRGEARGELVTELRAEDRRLGKVSPFWVPDADTTSCMQCQLKFTVIKRRHHCRACGQVLCGKCCGLKARLEYMNFVEARVCQPCFTILDAMNTEESSPPHRQPNPNNPMEYCSTIPPLQQVAGALHQPPPSVMVPVGVLKREGRGKSEVPKQVMFSDGIRPGGDLTELDGSGEPRLPFRRPGRLTKRVGTPPGGVISASMRRSLDPVTHSFIAAEGECLPPIISRLQGEQTLSDIESPISLHQPVVKFALNRNLFVHAKRVLLDCCVNRECWCLSSEGLACVGQDEVVFLLECLPQETLPPKDIFVLINHMYQEAAKGSTVSEMTFMPALSNNLLGSRDHGGFLFIRTSYQCTAQLALPSPPYLIAVLIHRWETPWARLFPLRLVLRLGAEFRYYPCPLVSVRNRAPLYTDIGHTIINILADFRKYSYTLPSVRGLVIHMEDRQTTINIPRNRYDQVVRALNNSNDSVLAFGANLSLAADSHLVCMQSSEDENTYHTQAINIHNKPRRVTGASFVVFNGALKVAGLAGKSSIVEDGLMVQVPAETMVALRSALRDMRDYTIGCGPNAEETVLLQWTADDTNFNIGVKSCIDGRQMDGVPSIRVHNGTDYSGGTRIIRWTEVFILQSEDCERPSEPLDISRLSESIARATCLALVPLLDLLSTAGLTSLAVRTTIHPDNVGYEAGSNGDKLPPLYMKSLDEELIGVVHQAALASQDSPAVLELVFRIMEQG